MDINIKLAKLQRRHAEFIKEQMRVDGIGAMLPMSEIMQNNDLPSYLSSTVDTWEPVKGACPDCGKPELSGIYEADTNAIYDVHCQSCGWTE